MKKDKMNLLRIPFSCFHLLNILTSIFLIYNQYYLTGSFILLGYISCVTSDLILNHATFIKDFKRRDFPIMLFYLIGQFSTFIGIILLFENVY